MLPRIGLTAGDPAGIGPEIARKAMNDPRVRAVCEPLFYGADRDYTPGVLSAEAGRASYEIILRAVRDAQSGGIQAIATAPINKEALSLAALPWRGHTEMLAELTHAPNVAMMFWSEKLRVVLATIHIPLAAVPAAITVESLRSVIELTHRELPRFGIPKPRLALAGLNPHAGEHGVLGDEETRVLEPAVALQRGGGHQYLRSVSRRYDLFARIARGVRRGDRVLSRPGLDSDKDGGVRAGRQRHAGTADHPDIC